MGGTYFICQYIYVGILSFEFLLKSGLIRDKIDVFYIFMEQIQHILMKSYDAECLSDILRALSPV